MGTYLTSEKNHELHVYKQSVGECELFLASLEYGKCISLSTFNNKIVSVDKNFLLTAIKTNIQPSERFFTKPGAAGTVALQSQNSLKFISSDPSSGIKMLADKGSVKECEGFKCEIHDNGLVAFRTYHNTYVAAENDHLVYNHPHVGQSEKFKIIVHSSVN